MPQLKIRNSAVYSLCIALLLNSGCLVARRDSQTRETSSTTESDASTSLIKFPSGNSFQPESFRLDQASEEQIVTWIAQKTTLAAQSDYRNRLAKGLQAGLSKAEVSALYYYSDSGYLDFAAYFRKDKSERYGIGGGQPSDEMLEQLFRATTSALNKLDKAEGDVFFGAILPGKPYLASLQPGSVFQNQNFTSTSRNLKTAMTFTGRNVHNPYGEGNASFFFKIERSKNGRFIGPYSQSTAEEEVLYLPNHMFRVRSITPVNNAGGQAQYDVVLTD